MPPRMPPPPLRSPASSTEVSVPSSRQLCMIRLHVAQTAITGSLTRCTGFRLTVRLRCHLPRLPHGHLILRHHTPHPSVSTWTATIPMRCSRRMPKFEGNLDMKMTTRTSRTSSSRFSYGQTLPTSLASVRLSSGLYICTSGICRSTFAGIRPSSPPIISPTYLTLVPCLRVLSITIAHDLTVA